MPSKLSVYRLLVGGFSGMPITNLTCEGDTHFRGDDDPKLQFTTHDSELSEAFATPLQ